MILHLTLKRKWFDMIASGEKKEEYREIKPYWGNRLLWHEYHQEVSCVNSLKDCIELAASDRFSDGVFRKDFEYVQFKNGYQKGAPTIKVELKGISYGSARPEWSDNWQGDVFIIHLGEIIHS